ncbi:enterobactin synthase subunit EntD [Citrobacter sp. Awk 4]|uniref:enterobactin synthase subunit EntD n=1 Tax=Citrobacter sp. Awk 4 TaxID=2963955 RepID=UPI002303C4F0|nr:enterobactin synthase subunit EntD [Citrobacter sp. Awk 4]MDA8477638.1 enterobactin synthase subunit EntD [Citrobacter sp. Awk 4]
MLTHHSTLSFAGHTLHCIAFDPDSFHEHDLFWLPHHAQLHEAGRKRKAEHLAGRIAAVYALRDYGSKAVPGIGEQRQPVWPAGLSGSISHCATTALAVVARQPVGVDMEAIFTPQMAVELTDSIIDNEEREILRSSTLPFTLALTLAFSAKESLYKAFCEWANPWPGFDSAKVSAINASRISLRLTALFSAKIVVHVVNVEWKTRDECVITLCQARPTSQETGPRSPALRDPDG